MILIGSGPSYAGLLLKILILAFSVCSYAYGSEYLFDLAYRALRFLKSFFVDVVNTAMENAPALLKPALEFIKNLGERVFDAIENGIRGVQKGIQGALDYLKELLGPLLRNAIAAFIVAYFLLRRR